MWKFWAVLGALLIGGGVYAVLEMRHPDKSTAPALQTEPLPPKPFATPAAVPPPVVVHHEVVPALTPQPAPPTPTPSAPVAKADPTPAPPAFVDSGSLDDLVPVPETELKVAPAPTPALASKPGPTAPPAAAAALEKFAGFEVIPVTIIKKDDGTTLLDNEYTLKGDGTADNPYIISWDLLASVESTFDPQNDKKRLPGRVTMLDGKFARLSGYVAFPMTSKEPRDLLSMLNQWDGCCIGTPPTPYDAVEVAMKGVVGGDDRFATTGRVTGIFHVKPYLQGDWLIGLYTMEDASLAVREFGGTRAN